MLLLVCGVLVVRLGLIGPLYFYDTVNSLKSVTHILNICPVTREPMPFPARQSTTDIANNSVRCSQCFGDNNKRETVASLARSKSARFLLAMHVGGQSA
jgi:hypothetical protein